MSAEVLYISSSCNLTPHSADWGRNDIICYGACNATGFYNARNFPDCGKVVSTIHTNSERVNTVCWLKTLDGSPETEGVSGSSDGKVVVWNYEDGRCSTLDGHTMTVTVVDGLYLQKQNNDDHCRAAVVVSASADSTVRIWKRKEANVSDHPDGPTNFVCVQTLSFGNGICLALSICFLPDCNALLLACATDDAKVVLFAENCREGDGRGQTEFVEVDRLAGHEDWVRALDFTTDDSGDVLLASASQDASIRLWRVSTRADDRAQKPTSKLGPTEDIEAEERVFSAVVDGSARHFAVCLESVLSGHEGWIYGVAWHPAVYEDGVRVRQPMALLSASMDKTMIVWRPDDDCGVWLEAVRVGDVGGNTLGFYGCAYGPRGAAIVAHGYQGAMHTWRYSEENASWMPGVPFGGHFKDVIDVQWEPEGQYLVSIGLDQTTRLHAPWVRQDRASWHELARPQVHGFDMSCLAVIGRDSFATGAEEKVIRSFVAPRNFTDNLRRISRVSVTQGAAQGASVPSLGLSNKAVYEGAEVMKEGRHVKNEYPEAYFTPIDLDGPPTEDNLLQNTLWPESRKLYGHGYELYALAASRDGSLLASACKATTAEHAAVILWDTVTWQERQRLASHSLTVTQLSFSPDALFLLSVSRDRTWSLFSRDPDGNYVLSARSDKKTGVHTRIIWCCDWSHDSRFFLTGSRDGKVVAWDVTGKSLSVNVPIVNDSVTSIAFAPDFVSAGVYLVAVGMDTGVVLLYKWCCDRPEEWVACLTIDRQRAHHLTVTRVAFRPVRGEAGRETADEGILQLASCGADHAVKIYNIDVGTLR